MIHEIVKEIDYYMGKDKSIHKRNLQQIRDYYQRQITQNISQQQKKNSLTYNFNKEMFDKGEQWFNNGFSLNDASLEIQKDPSFAAGFRKAQRTDSIDSQLFNLGREYFLEGKSLHDVPQNYIDKKPFIDGYNSMKIRNK